MDETVNAQETEEETEEETAPSTETDNTPEDVPAGDGDEEPGSDDPAEIQL